MSRPRVFRNSSSFLLHKKKKIKKNTNQCSKIKLTSFRRKKNRNEHAEGHDVVRNVNANNNNNNNKRLYFMHTFGRITLDACRLVGMGLESGVQQFPGQLQVAQAAQRVGFVENCVQRPTVEA